MPHHSLHYASRLNSGVRPLKSISAICLPLLALIGLRSGKQPIDVSGLTEASAAFDREHVEPFLLQVAGALPSGLSANAAVKLARNINGLWLGQTGNWEFAVILYDQEHRLVISGFKDDFSAPDIYFFSTPIVANSIRQQITSYFEAAGI